MKTEIIKPEKTNKEERSILTPIVYLILGIILAFKSEQATEVIFYIIGILVIIYGVKTLIVSYQNKDNQMIKNVNLTIALSSILIGILVIVLSGVIVASLRVVIGLFLIYMGVSRMISEISFGKYINFSNLSNLVLIVCGLFSVFYSNILLVIVGWILIVNAIILIWEYVKNVK